MPNKDHALKPNMFAELRILAGDNQNRLLIPKEAVIRGGQQDRVVLTLGAGRFKSLAVKTGQRDGQQVEILEGLKAGEEVVVSAQFLLDSESSKTSDFARIDVDEPVKSDKPSQVWVEIKVNEIYPDKMKVNVDHAPIEAWMWPQMTIDFKLDEFVDLDELKPGLVAHAQVTRTPEKKYLITDLHIPEEGSEKGGMPRQSESADIAGMDHSQHQMPSEADSSKAKEPTQAEKPKKVWVKGTINSIDAKAMKVNAQHEAIPEWSWPEMTMDFKLDEFIDLDELPTGQMLHLEVTRTDGSSYLITDFFLPEAE
jgi:Cu(I)/Ag(I) efflux system membrane fusion protein